MVTRCITDLEKCHCACHSRPGIKHVTACCFRCPYCGYRIRRTSYDQHEAKCAEKHNGIRRPGRPQERAR